MMRYLLMALVLSFAVPAMAQAPTLPPALEQQKLAGGQIVYLGQHGSMHGWVLIRRGQPEFYYAPEDGSALVLGILFDAEGRPVTPSQVAAIEADAQRSLSHMVTPPVPEAAETAPQAAPVEATPAPVQAEAPKAQTTPDTPARQLFTAVQNGATLLWGQATAPKVYAFIDPNCGHCGQFLKDITPYVDQGRVAVQILPAGFRMRSVNQAAFMLAASDGVERLLRYKDGDTGALPDGDISTTAVDHNMNILTDWDLRLTPVILYETPKGDIKLVRGRPFDIDGMVKDALGE